MKKITFIPAKNSLINNRKLKVVHSAELVQNVKPRKVALIFKSNIILI